jgi:hypothetical protein
LKSLYTLILIFLCSNLAQAQPGWQDFTKRYSYNILDKNGKEISFKNNKNYSIMIDSVLYKSPNIPQDSLKPALVDSYNGFENQIRINDFSLAIPQKKYQQSHNQLEIKIIHKNDTMYICQSSGRGSFRSIDFQGKPIKQTPDYTLQFIAGHYYFPSWAKNLLDNIPQTSGNTKIVNVSQQHFIIPKSVYDSVNYISPRYENRQKHYDEAENSVVKNFMKGYFSFERQVQLTTFDRSVSPFNKPRWSTWGSSYFPTKEQDEYLGNVQFSYDTLNYSGGRGMIVRYNYNENKMKIWSPTEKLMFSSTALLYKDTFNDVYYNRSIIRDSNCKELIYKCDFVNKFYNSIDEGKVWKEDKRLTQLYKTHGFRQLEFLDQNHALIFKLDKVKVKNKKYDLQQGTYYLLKDFQIIDSLKSPNDLHYNDNYNRYKYEIKNDTIFLGSWSYNKFQVGKTYSQPFLVKDNDNWKFKVTEQLFYRTKTEPKMDMITYQNFKILNNLMYLNTENGSLDLKSDLLKLHENGLILENGEHIYIIGLGIGTLLSFDGGNTWFVYPLPLEKDSRYDFLEINEQGVISHLKNSWTGNGYEFNKVFSQFSKIEVK